MAQGYKDFTAGSALAAADLEDYCQNQSVMRFASSAARDTALSSVKTEGMLSYQVDNNDLDIYTGSAFSTLIAPAHGAWTSWTPTVTQSASVSGSSGSYYIRIGRLIIASLYFAPSSSGTAANDIVITLPVTARGGTTVVYAGPAVTIEDTSATSRFTGVPVMVSTTTFKVMANVASTTAYMGSTTFTAAITTGDFIYGQLMYEAAADA